MQYRILHNHNKSNYRANMKTRIFQHLRCVPVAVWQLRFLNFLDVCIFHARQPLLFGKFRRWVSCAQPSCHYASFVCCKYAWEIQRFLQKKAAGSFSACG